MTTVFIANVSKQNHLFCYHAKGDHAHGKLIELTIDRGTQIKIEDTPEVLDKVITRYQRFGMIDVKEVGRVRVFSGLMFQYDKPINIERLKEAVERKREMEDERANDMRMIGVLGAQDHAKEVAREVGLPDISVTSEIQEQQTNESANSNVKPLKQKLSVDAEGGIRRRTNA